eukprot:1202754-Pleurochrysis_carterae.AAC.1
MLSAANYAVSTLESHSVASALRRNFLARAMLDMRQSKAPSCKLDSFKRWRYAQIPPVMRSLRRRHHALCASRWCVAALSCTRGTSV